MHTDKEKNISAEEFVDALLSEGTNIACDTTNETFRSQGDCLPPYYNQILYKRGQELYKKYMYSMDLIHAFGVLVLYSIPTALNVALSATGSSFKLYETHIRQLRTNLNIQSFYYSDLRPNSNAWKTLKKIKMKHNKVSKGSSNKSLNPLTQLDMAVAQFAFFGLGSIRAEFVGLQAVSEEDWKGLHHYWRVMGYLLGIEERFNICSPPLDTSKKIAEYLVQKLILPEMEKKNPIYLNTTKVASLCFKPMLLELETNCVVNYLYNLLKQRDVANMYVANYVDLKWYSRVYYKFFVFSLISLLKWRPYKILRNTLHRINMYLITTFPSIPRLECEIFDYLYL
ncbi:uncharacterized protein LOC130447334 isoform X1 [Diorhabda sublineata]|uniref:uncharacterized protein LOC130447334 isoform X1 n=2 Tax=Diorhabda sublineata TaxID=1163346 RepID=UPI0024E14C95|nr:uncharacterized protein LOC130447334 isoform X1 [Diorhabda sublineata]